MATLTANILVGSPHPNHDGIQPSHYLFLSENSRPAWVLVQQNLFNKENRQEEKITWIPTVEDMLEDAILMIAVHVQKNQGILELASTFTDNIESERLELYEVFNESQRKQLYEECRKISDFPKLIVSVFQGSTIKRQLKVVEQYKMDVEVCSPVYARLFSLWSKETNIIGSLSNI